MKLVAFDGDNTLWEPLSGVNLSDRTPDDDEGWPDFSYELLSANPPIARRDDGAMFGLRPEAREVFEELRRRGALIGVVSYNHAGNIERILKAFGLLTLVDYLVAEWHTNKDNMLRRMLEMAGRDGHDISAQDVIFVDDDPSDIYRGQATGMGIAFFRFGSDMTDLRQILPLI